MPTILEFLPKIGFGPIKLGMREADIESFLGKPNYISEKRRGRYSAVYNDFSITYSPEKVVVNIEVYMGSVVTYEGRNIFTDPSVRQILIREDGDAKVISGTIVLLNLGLSMWEDEEEEDQNKTIVAFSEGEWDNLLDRMKSYS
ncbi:MAG: hypothetical protein N0E44_02555 [Candidatus Thiodiazotropha lotti]|nr:hypothetical protein [Candidatus Thiodiazotropha lotti]MCG8012197.1 hypothetical protein [Candidatus Thiodiazotropha lotti]MCW4211667.1 hypothetical protein [Candidatus Thiodiazotropha lotti]MCW4218759.1 hypothetical protein [Candidatus Thiodiazotropha lotti]